MALKQPESAWFLKERLGQSGICDGGNCAGPRSRDILTSGLERLAPGQELPSPHKPAARLAERRSSIFGNQVDSDIDSDEELSLDGSSQQPGVSLLTFPTGFRHYHL